ncbi:MAG: hypothetical protein JXB47_05945 [Anaerolineae bacterium]|nr:hypothetical protein [Anaerolineae bacterium]
MIIDKEQTIGRVLRGSTTSFVCGTRINKLEAPQFGAFVEAACGNGNSQDHVIGLIHAIRIEDDPLVRQLILADNVTEQTLQDQRENRMVPVEISILNVGYVHSNAARQALPPRPPLSLAEVRMCSPGAVRAFCARFDFFRLVLSAAEVPTDELLAACLSLAAEHVGASGSAERRAFLVNAGRELAKLMSQDLGRLENILKLIRAAA